MSGSSTPARGGVDPQSLDLSALNLTSKSEEVVEEPPKMSFAREKLLEEARRAIEVERVSDKKGVSLVVVGMWDAIAKGMHLTVFSPGHVDAGKSTLMGRLMYELGRLDEKTRSANERGSNKVGKSSFSWAWGLDGTAEERERLVDLCIIGPCHRLNREIEALRWILRFNL